MSSYITQLTQEFPTLNFEVNKTLAPYTTVKIGGPAEIFVEIKDRDTFVKVCQFATQYTIPITILGWGANTLISDNGIPGLVIRNSTNEITVLDKEPSYKTIATIPSRWKKSDVNKDYYDFTDLEFSEDEQTPKVVVDVSTGVSLPMLINNLLNQGITGLQWFSRIPASVGGAIYNNIHGGTHFISEYISSVTVLNEHGELVTLSPEELDFDYDYSRFHTTKEILISAEFVLHRGNAEKAKQVAIDWAIRKKIQPQNSLGCVFQNLTQEQMTQANIDNPAAGYIIDQILGLKGHRIGNAQISEKHSAFIENLGDATAVDYLALIRLIQTRTQTELGVKLIPEIFFLGFQQSEIEDIIG